MTLGSNRYQASLIREDAYFSEVDQLLLANLRETLELQQEAARVADNCGDREEPRGRLYADSLLGIKELAEAR